KRNLECTAVKNILEKSPRGPQEFFIADILLVRSLQFHTAKHPDCDSYPSELLLRRLLGDIQTHALAFIGHLQQVLSSEWPFLKSVVAMKSRFPRNSDEKPGPKPKTESWEKEQQINNWEEIPSFR
ncbi:hypothetical protein AVEN_51802-1, partial [Araneus ventricosus]